MIIKFKKWFEEGGFTRYKIVLPAENFTNCPTTQVILSIPQIVKGENGYRITLFGKGFEGFLERLGITPTGYTWDDEKPVGTRCVSFSTPWLKKKDILAILENLLPMLFDSWAYNQWVKPQFQDLKLK